jgi:hypothetical protein
VLHSAKSLYGYRVGANDGLAGVIVDFYFNDQNWSVPQVVASEHPTRFQKAILLSPAAVRQVDSRENVVHVSLSKAECGALPPATSLLPVCRQYESRTGVRPIAAHSDPHLRCATAVAGYEIHDPEKHLGIIHDLLIDTREWKIAFLVGRRFGLRQHEFLVPASAVGRISFASRRVAIAEASHWDLVFAERNPYDRLLSPQVAQAAY